MQRLFLFLSTAFIYSYSFAQNKQVSYGKYFKISDVDSVFLEVYDNLDTLSVSKMITEEKKDLMIIFQGITNLRSIDVLQAKFLKDKRIVDILQTYKIVQLFVDDRAKVDSNDRFTIGEKNMLYQRDRFRMTMQPYFIILKNGEPKCYGGYKPPKEFLEWLEGCKKK
jgi:hypothetical protein